MFVKTCILTAVIDFFKELNFYLHHVTLLPDVNLRHFIYVHLYNDYLSSLTISGQVNNIPFTILYIEYHQETLFDVKLYSGFRPSLNYFRYYMFFLFA